MVNILRRQYGSMKKIYISWDAAGWHISKALGKHVEFLNGWAEPRYTHKSHCSATLMSGRPDDGRLVIPGAQQGFD